MTVWIALPLALLLSGKAAWGSDRELDRAVAGGRLYRSECAPCHGSSARGDGPEAWLFSPAPPNLRIAALQRHDPAALARRILDGVTESIVPSPRALVASASRTEAVVSHLQRLPDVNWTLAERGRSAYLDRCERCHGAFGHPGPVLAKGANRAPPDLVASALPADERELAVLVRHGKRGMPALPAKLGDEDVESLAAFMRLLSPGYETYQVACARCHGDHGRPPGDRAHPTVVFDRAYFAAHDAASVRAKVWHMLGERNPQVMPHFRGVLTDAQAHAIVAYLRLLPSQ